MALLLFVFLATDASAQFGRRATYKILGVSVEGNKSADANTVIANSGLKVGEEITIGSDATLKAINRLWNLGIFKDVQVFIDKKIDNGVFLLIKVKEFPRVEDVLIEGEDEIGEDDILEEISMIPGQTLKDQEIFNIKRKIRNLYEEDGYLNVKIDPRQYEFFKADTSDDEITVLWKNIDDPTEEYETEYDYDPDVRSRLMRKVKNRVLLVIYLDEGDEVIIRNIEFSGNSAFEDGDLKGEFEETSEARWWKFWSSSNFKKDLFTTDKEVLTTFYRKNGYRDFRILKDSLKYDNDKKDLSIFIDVYEGPQYKLRDVVFSGNTVFKDEVLMERLDFEKGDVYDLEKFQQNLRFNEKQTDISSLYQDRGYLTFNLQQREEKVGDDSLDIFIDISENNRFRIGKLDITGNDKTMEKVIRRELYTVPGDYYNRAAVLRSIQQLANLQYFNVEQLYQTGVNPVPVSDSTVNLLYTVEEKSSDYLNASIGYSGAFGFSGAIGVTLTNFSIQHPFSMGGGEVLNFNWQFGVGNYYRTFNLGYTQPWFNDTPTLVGFDLFDTRQNYVYELSQSGISFKVGRRLKWPDNYFYIQGSLKFQYNDVKEGRNWYPEGISRQYTLGATISRTDIDNPVFPSRGSKLALNMELSGGPLLPGDVDYYKVLLNVDWYKQLFNTNRITMYTNVNLGYINELVKGTTIQPFEFFYMGGNGMIIATTPLRGYDDRTVGPRNSQDDVIGGRVMTKYTFELRGALALEPMPIYLIGFAEAGNTYLDLNHTDLFELRRSAGFGARIMINPIGLIGFDYGYGFDREAVDGADPAWKFHFQFGRGF